MSQFNQRNKRNRAPFPEFLIKAEFKTKFHAQIRKIQFVLRNIIQLSAAYFLCLKSYGINSFKIIDLAIVQYIFLSILRLLILFFLIPLKDEMKLEIKLSTKRTYLLSPTCTFNRRIVISWRKKITYNHSSVSIRKSHIALHKYVAYASDGRLNELNISQRGCLWTWKYWIRYRELG